MVFIHSVKREVACKRQVLSIAVFLYNGTAASLLAFTCPPVEAGSHGYL